MSDTLIKVENVSKKFCRRLKRSLWYGMKDLGSELIGRSNSHKDLRKDEFWANKDISFELKRGDTLGLIGCNGAGKTTLLRMLNGLIKPDKGRIEVRGRMQALVALGAGFNPVLTGRENIYVNAAVLGIPKAEVDRRYDEIVDFSGVEEFIDTPVQSYSSGMAVRLGFAVAVHMEPDILLVDEVLAVGDVSFRAKCHKKLRELKEKGVPWILVSHDMGTIMCHTNKVVFLENGRIKFIGHPDEAICKYMYSTSEQAYLKNMEKHTDIRDNPALKQQEAQVTKVTLLDGNQKEKDIFKTGEPLIIKIDYIAHKKIENPSFGAGIYGGDGIFYCGSNTRISEYHIDFIEGVGSVFFKMPSLILLSGLFRVRVDIADKHMGTLDSVMDAANIKVQSGKFKAGMFSVEHSWDIKC